MPNVITVVQQFRARARERPAAVALRGQAGALTYAELERWSDAIAHALLASGSGPGRTIAVALARTPALPATLLGILKSGARYVALDPSYPRERLAFMLAESSPAALVTAGPLRELAGAQLPVLEVVPQPSSGELAPVDLAAPDADAYVVFTSGSTGRPRGVRIGHDNLGHYVQALAGALGIVPSDRCLHTASFSFSSSVRQLFMPLALGAEVILADEAEVRDPFSLWRRAAESGATIMDLVPSHWRALTEALASLTAAECRRAIPATLRQVQSASEPLRADLPRAFRALVGPHVRLVNMYGQSETTGIAACYPIPEDLAEGIVPIGAPIAETRLHVLDAARAPVPAGSAGDIWVGGRGVGRGYLSAGAEEQARFVAEAPGAGATRLYRTGDRGKLRSDGAIDFLGRDDQQMKIRGFRVETGEIEAALMRHASVREAVVVASNAGAETELVAFLAGPAAKEVGAIRAHLAQILPSYMVPARLLCLPALPRTPNGKIDRTALASAAREREAMPAVDAEGDREGALAALFAEVLSVEVRPDDDFFVLGGDSLKAMQVIVRARARLGVDLPVSALLGAPTPRALARILERQSTRADAPARAAATGGETDTAPLSASQARVWFLEQLSPNEATYHVPMLLELRGALDRDALERAVAALVQRQPALRTRFTISAEGEPLQAIAREVSLPVALVDARELSQDELTRRMELEATRPFDLRNGPLVRAVLYQRGPAEHRLLWVMHHLICDGWSVGVIMRELGELYSGDTLALPPLPLSYGEYARRQRSELDTLRAQETYWRHRLEGAPTLELSTDKPRPAQRTSRGATHTFTLDAALLERLERLAADEGATLFMAVMAAYQLLLARHAHQEEVVVATPVAGRDRPELEPLVGFFVNTVALRTELSGEPSYRELLRRVKTAVLEALDNQALPFERVVQVVNPPRDPSRTPLAQASLVFQNMLLGPCRAAGLEISLAGKVDTHTAKFDLDLHLYPVPTGMLARFEYSTDLFDAETIEALGAQLRTLLEAALDAPDSPAARLPLLTRQQRVELLAASSGEVRELGPPRTLHALFEAQVDRDPSAVAASFRGQQLSYRELERESNRLARHLRSCGVGRETPVGLCLEHSFEELIAVLAILKAGGCYVPLDAANPPERQQRMVRTAGLALVLTSPERRANLACDAEPILVSRGGAAWSSESDARLEPLSAPGDLAYVLFTSGSTGEPKGVEVEHRAVVNLTRWFVERAGLGPGSRASLATNFTFDVHVQDVWPTLAAGATAVIVEHEQLRLDSRRFLAWLEAERVQSCFLPTPLAEALLELVPPPGLVLDLLVAAGDALHHGLRRPSSYKLLNAYGPTEATVYATACEVGVEARPPPIGAPLPNYQAYVLDAAREPVPVGVAGELYLGGAGLARGYRGRPDLTEERFVANPFGPAGSRLYRTGDLVRRRRDGLIEYLGRLDQQVKIRGFRIELEEIEAHLRSHPDVADAVVSTAPAPDGQKQLVGYVVPRGSVRDEGALARHLAARLPAHMTPSAWCFLESIPLNANGKRNRKALPLPAPRTAGIAPRNEVEEAIAGIWCEMLGLASVGVTDDFFQLGGHSLLAANMLAEIEQRLQFPPPMAPFFREPTVESLARAVEDGLMALLQR